MEDKERLRRILNAYGYDIEEGVLDLPELIEYAELSLSSWFKEKQEAQAELVRIRNMLTARGWHVESDMPLSQVVEGIVTTLENYQKAQQDLRVQLHNLEEAAKAHCHNNHSYDDHPCPFCKAVTKSFW